MQRQLVGRTALSAQRRQEVALGPRVPPSHIEAEDEEESVGAVYHSVTGSVGGGAHDVSKNGRVRG
jgi:hypothetical protein